MWKQVRVCYRKSLALVQAEISPLLSEVNTTPLCTVSTLSPVTLYMSVLNFKHHSYFSLHALMNTTTSHTCTLQCATQTGAGTRWLIKTHTRNPHRHHPRKYGMSSTVPLESPGSHELFVLLIGRGWPINASVLGPDHWLSACWWSVKCAINLGHGPQHIRVSERPGKGFLSLGWMAKQGSQGPDDWSN